MKYLEENDGFDFFPPVGGCFFSIFKKLYLIILYELTYGFDSFTKVSVQMYLLLNLYLKAGLDFFIAP